MIAPPATFQTLVKHWRSGRGSPARRDVSGSFCSKGTAKMSPPDSASPKVEGKILQYENFINEVLKRDLE